MSVCIFNFQSKIIWNCHYVPVSVSNVSLGEQTWQSQASEPQKTVEGETREGRRFETRWSSDVFVKDWIDHGIAQKCSLQAGCRRILRFIMLESLQVLESHCSFLWLPAL